MSRGLLAAVLLALLAAPARAFRADPEGQRDAKRFHFGGAAQIRQESTRAGSAIDDFNRRRGGLGLQGLAAGGNPARTAQPVGAAAQFLREKQKDLGLDPATLTLERQSAGPGHKHLLYHQTYNGLPVEFSRIKVHLADDGSVIGFDSNYQNLSGFDATPRIPVGQAADIVRRDAGLTGHSLESRGQLVIFPADGQAPPKLAWKFTAKTTAKLWRYYVDAKTGDLLFRYNDRQEFTGCVTSGTISAQVFDIDPRFPAVIRPMNNVAVYVKDGATWSMTGGDDGSGVGPPLPYAGGGAYCSLTQGQIFTQMQGPYVNVSNFRGPSAHYDNGQGTWRTVATPLSSPHPYSGNSVYISTLDLTSVAPSAVKFLPVFSAFNVGSMAKGAFGEADDIQQDDQVAIINSTGQIVGGFLGDYSQTPYKIPFNAAAVTGQIMRIRLKSMVGPGGVGYDVGLSSYLALGSPSSQMNNNNVVWYATMTVSGMRSEIDLMYHLNRMHDYFVADVDKSSAAYLTPVNAIAFAGPSLANAFYDPDFDDLWFGDVNGASPQDWFGDDATVPHHEYVHFMVAKIWPIQNFGQAGTISEANADYFSASSLNDSSIGTFVLGSFGGMGALRELSCPDKIACQVYSPGTWQGEIHADSIFVSQALWDIRKAMVAAHPTVLWGDSTGRQVTVGQSCVDGLLFQALLFFPESFQELLNALQTVDSAGAVAACGIDYGGDARNRVQATINAAFAAHGLGPVGGTNDPYDTLTRHNDGFQTAVDISTLGAVSGTIFPQADVDFFTFGAGPGSVVATLTLPFSSPYYKAYMLTLYNSNHVQVGQAAPPFNGTGTVDGVCTAGDCNTTASQVVLSYNNPTGQQLFIEVSGGAPTENGGSVSGVHSTIPYTLQVSFNQTGALGSSIVSAKFDNDVFNFSVKTTTFVATQPYQFAYAQLRDHALSVIPNTLTHVPPAPGDYMVMLSSQNGGGTITGQLQLLPGFATRFPAVGTVHVEVFGAAMPTAPYGVSQSTVSLGLSNPLELTTNTSAVTAWNNVFNPNLGQKTTIKWDIVSPGHVTMKLYTLSGTFIATLADDDYPAGKGAVDWFGRNKSGGVVANGVYLLHITAPGVDKTVKIAVIK